MKPLLCLCSTLALSTLVCAASPQPGIVLYALAIDNLSLTPVPEPASPWLLLLGLSLVSVRWLARR